MIIEFKLTTVVAERSRGAFCNVVIKWHYKITTGSRCKGLLSGHQYTCPVKAVEAGERMLAKLKNNQ